MLQQSKKVYVKVKKTFDSSTDCLIKLVLQEKYFHKHFVYNKSSILLKKYEILQYSSQVANKNFLRDFVHLLFLICATNTLQVFYFFSKTGK